MAAKLLRNQIEKLQHGCLSSKYYSDEFKSMIAKIICKILLPFTFADRLLYREDSTK